MDENKIQNGANEVRKPAPPPMPQKKEPEVKAKGQKNGKNKKVLILIPIIIALIIGALVVAIVLKNSEGGKGGNSTTLAPVVVTDPNGEVVTDENGEILTVVPETEVQHYTDENGQNKTTVVYKDFTFYIPVVNNKGETVTDKKGDVVTEQHIFIPTTQKQENVVVGTSGVPVTDGQGHTTIDNQGNVLTTVVEITSEPAIVQPAVIDWKASTGGSKADYISSVASFKDGSYITATVTNSTDGDFAQFKDLKLATPYTVLTKYNKNGGIVWQNAVGSKRGLLALSNVVTLEDGTFYAVGYGKNIGGETGKGYYDGAVYKFDKNGDELWYNVFGTSTVDLFNGACVTKDGGLVAVGSVGNNDGDAEGFGKPEYASAAAIVKYSPSGDVVWKDIIGGDQDSLTGVVESTDGSIYCIGNFYTDTFFKNLGYADGCVLKYTGNGKYVDARALAGSGNETFNGITACKDGGIAIVGRSNSSDAGSTDSMFVSDLASRGGYDAYIVKFNSSFNVSFAKAFRGQNDDNLTSIIEAEDGSFIVAGASNSSSRDLRGVTTRGGSDIVIASFNRYGELSWARSFGGTKNESASAICLADDGGYIVAGRTLSKDIDMKGISHYVTDKSVGVVVKFPK